jgi:hypothetical protein
MDPVDLDAIDAREAAATPGLWIASTTGYPTVFRGHHTVPYIQADADFIAHARTDVPAMSAELRELRAEIQQRQQAWEDNFQSVKQLVGERDRLVADNERLLAVVEVAERVVPLAERLSVGHTSGSWNRHARRLARLADALAAYREASGG